MPELIKTKNIRMESENASSVLRMGVKHENRYPASGIKSSEGHSSFLVDEKVTAMVGGPVLEIKRGKYVDSASNTLEKNQATDEITPINAPNGIGAKTTRTKTSTSRSCSDSISGVIPTENETKSDSRSSQKESNLNFGQN